MNEIEMTPDMTKLEQLKAVREYVEDNPIEFTVNGETEGDEQTFIRYYNLAHNMLPDLMAAADELQNFVDYLAVASDDDGAYEPEIQRAMALLTKLRGT